MTVPGGLPLPLAHAGHWLPSLAVFGGPVVALWAYVTLAGRRERRRRERERRPGGPR